MKSMAVERDHIREVKELAEQAARVVALGAVVVLAEESERITPDTSEPVRVIAVKVGVRDADVGAVVGRDGKVARALWRLVSAGVWRRQQEGLLPRDLPRVYLSVLSYDDRAK